MTWVVVTFVFTFFFFVRRTCLWSNPSFFRQLSAREGQKKRSLFLTSCVSWLKQWILIYKVWQAGNLHVFQLTCQSSSLLAKYTFLKCPAFPFPVCTTMHGFVFLFCTDSQAWEPQNHQSSGFVGLMCQSGRGGRLPHKGERWFNSHRVHFNSFFSSTLYRVKWTLSKQLHQ